MRCGGAFKPEKRKSRIPEWRGSAPPRRDQFLQTQATPHLHEGPQLQAFASVPHLQMGAQVQGLHWQVLVIGKRLWFGWWSDCSMAKDGRTIERSG